MTFSSSRRIETPEVLRVGSGSPICAMAEEYTVNVSITDSNLYLDRSNHVLIKTSLCLEIAIMDKAILVYDEINCFGCGKSIFLNSGTLCQVNGVYNSGD
jgi:hypothetical protein